MFVVVVLFSYSNVVVVVVVFCSHSIFVNEDPQINNLDVNAKNANMEGRDKRWEVELRRGREGMGGDGDWYKIGHFNLTQEPSFFIHKANTYVQGDGQLVDWIQFYSVESVKSVSKSIQLQTLDYNETFSSVNSNLKEELLESRKVILNARKLRKDENRIQSFLRLQYEKILLSIL